MPGGATHMRNRNNQIALRFVILLGVVSLFADMTYEAARSITGPYLAILGASATVVGIVAGLGELIGYGLRIVSGVISTEHTDTGRSPSRDTRLTCSPYRPWH